MQSDLRAVYEVLTTYKLIGDVLGKRLVEAGKKGDLDLVRDLVKRPMINIDASDFTGWTALHFAVQNRQEEMVEVLAEIGRAHV